LTGRARRGQFLQYKCVLFPLMNFIYGQLFQVEPIKGTKTEYNFTTKEEDYCRLRCKRKKKKVSNKKVFV
jgi:hypothetical protein